MTTQPGAALLINRDDLRQTNADPIDPPRSPEHGQITLNVEKFGLTANNITYAVFGQAMRYWHFFPGPEGWSHLPVWGFGEVLDSTVDAIKPGERFYGYYPTSTYATFSVDPTGSGFTEVSKHRQGLAGAYNQYLRTTDDAAYDPEYENEQMIIRPLFMTSFLLADFLQVNETFGAKRVIISSASSKTALSLAFLLSRHPQKPEVVGLTSQSNASFCKQTGYYDSVVPYEQVATLSRVDSVYVDMSGSSTLRTAVHNHLGDLLKHSSGVGATHWEDNSPTEALPGPSPAFFFAPNHMSKRAADWGEGGLHQHFATAWRDFRGTLKTWMQVVEEQGPEALQKRYLELLEGRTSPAHAHILSI